MSETIAERIKLARNRANLSTTQITKMTGISEGNLSEWESGHFKPTAKNAILLSEVLGVSIDWLLTGKANQPFLITNENKEVVEFLQGILDEWEKSDEAMRGWIVVQLRRAFPELAEKMVKDK